MGILFGPSDLLLSKAKIKSNISGRKIFQPVNSLDSK